MLNKHKYSKNDLVILAGDFNVDSRHPTHPAEFLDAFPDLRRDSLITSD